MNVCISANCPYYEMCAKAAVNNPGTHAAVDWANMGGGSMSVDSDGKTSVSHYNCCGLAGEFQLFEAIPESPYGKLLTGRAVILEDSTPTPEVSDTLVLHCKEILLKHKSLEISISTPFPENIKTLVINGHKFRREE